MNPRRAKISLMLCGSRSPASASPRFRSAAARAALIRVTMVQSCEPCSCRCAGGLSRANLFTLQPQP